MIYLDTSAIVKLIRPEAESAAITGWLNAHGSQRTVTSVLAEVEVPRALRRDEPARLGAIAGVMARLDRLAIDDAVRATAAADPYPLLRSLDAIHLATADLLVAAGKTVTAFVTCDKRMFAFASGIGLTAAAPGAEEPRS